VKIRQALGRMLVPSAIFAKLSPALQDEIKAELNVERIESFASAGDLVDHSAKGNFRNLGKRFAKRTPLVAKAIAELDAAWLAEQLRDLGRAVMRFEGEDIELTADDVIVTERPREGWSVVNEQGETVALDLELTPELILAGQAREVIRFVQEARKRAGLDVSDRISLVVEAAPELAEAVAAHRDLIAAEVLAVELIQDVVDAPTDEDQELNLRIALRKA
jgi:isoleucyl-tRNA synthetase